MMQAVRIKRTLGVDTNDQKLLRFIGNGDLDTTPFPMPPNSGLNAAGPWVRGAEYPAASKRDSRGGKGNSRI